MHARRFRHSCRWSSAHGRANRSRGPVPRRSHECAQAAFQRQDYLILRPSPETFDEVTPCSSAAIKASITHEITFDHCGSSSRVADARGSREMTSGSSKYSLAKEPKLSLVFTKRVTSPARNYILVLVFGNIADEELWGRGFCYRAKKPLVGPMAWLLHGLLWAAFHLLFQTTV